jgi:archaellum component FlaF (FlaF/FlaG flagellin family)
MRRLFFLFFWMMGCYASLSAQTNSREQQFINENFPHYRLCDWTPGMKFMCLPERKDILLPVFKSVDTDREVSMGPLKRKIFEYLGYEDTERGHLRINFECEGKQYYYEQKNISFEEFCLKPKAGVPSLAYLADVDIAKELLVGQTLYINTDKVRVDDNSSTAGYRDVSITRNTKVTVTQVDIYSRSFPVKVTFQDERGNTYFQPLAMSKTNCGMIDNDFIMENKNKTFPNAFTFGDANTAKSATLMEQLGNKEVYLKNATTLKDAYGSEVKKARYTQFKVTDIVSANGTQYVTLKLADSEGNAYQARVTFVETTAIQSVLQDQNYFSDVFGTGNLRTKYPNISEGNWELISNGEVRKGMTMDECRLSLGDPIRVQRVNGTYETWYYKQKILEFTDKKLERAQ